MPMKRSPLPRTLTPLVSVALLASSLSSGRAQELEHVAGASAPRPDEAPSAPRVPPDYDGREDASDPVEGALWVPRVLLFPLYVVSEYVVRRPLGALTQLVEKENILSKLEDAFTFGPNDNIGIIPTALIDFGFHGSVGVYFFWNDFLAPDNDLRVNVSTGGHRWLKGQVANRIPLGGGTTLQLEGHALQRPDLRYWGTGYDSVDEAEGAFEIRALGGGLRLRDELAQKGSFFESWVVGRALDFGNGECEDPTVWAGEPPRFGCEEPTIRGAVRTGKYPIPPGFEGYSLVEAGTRLVLDSRAPRPDPGSGVALDLNLRKLALLEARSSGGWLAWGGSAAAFLDLTGTQRVLSLTVSAQFVSPTTGATEIPFTELVGARRHDDRPDADLLHGFRPGRVLGESATVASLEYRWPVWTWVDGILQTGVGNTFGPHLEDFAPERLRFALSGGLRSANHRDHSLNVLLGFGTETFEQGAAPMDLRFMVGGSVGF